MREMSLTEIKNVQLDILKKLHTFCEENNLQYSVAYGTAIGAIRHKGFIPWDDDIDVMMPRKDYELLIKTFNAKQADESKYKLTVWKNEPSYELFIARIERTDTIFSNIDYPIGVNIDIFPIDNLANSRKKAYKIFNFYRIIAKLAPICRRTTVLNCKRLHGKQLIIRFILSIITRLFPRDFFFKLCEKKITKGPSKKFVSAIFNTTENVIFEQDWFDKFIEVPFEDTTAKIIEKYDEYLKVIFGDYMTLPPKEDRVGHYRKTKGFWK